MHVEIEENEIYREICSDEDIIKIVCRNQEVANTCEDKEVLEEPKPNTTLSMASRGLLDLRNYLEISNLCSPEILENLDQLQKV